MHAPTSAGPDRSELVSGVACPSAGGFELLDLLGEPGPFRLDLVELPVQSVLVGTPLRPVDA